MRCIYFWTPASLAKFSLAALIQNSADKLVQWSLYFISDGFNLISFEREQNSNRNSTQGAVTSRILTAFPQRVALIHKVLKPKSCLVLIPGAQ